MKAPPKKKKAAPTYDRIPDGQRIIALDVSSSAAGWAVGESVNGKIAIHRFGRIKPPSKWESSRRIQRITDDVCGLCERYDEELLSKSLGTLRVVMEWQSHMRAAGARSINGLATLGQAQGSVWRRLDDKEFPIDHVSEREWTKDKGWPVKKEIRAEKIRMLVPDYAQYVKSDQSLDSGLDVSDALGILIWRLTR